MTARALPRRRFALLFALSAATVSLATAPALAADWGNNHVEGSGRIKTETRSLAGVHGVSMALAGNVEVHIGNSESVTIETDDNLLPLIETVVENGTLKIRPSKRNVGLSSHHMRLIVQARSLDRLSLGGSGNIDADAMRGAKTVIDLGGSGNINVKTVDSDALEVDLGGSGELKVAGGRAAALSVSLAGSGSADLGRVQNGSAKVNLAGSGDATVAARDQLSVDIIGSGSVNYYGDPKLSRTVIGSGSANRLGAHP